MKKLIIILLLVIPLVGCTKEAEYPRQNKTGDSYDIVFGGTGTDTPEMFTAWYNPKTNILKLNLENICEQQRSPSEHTYVNYQSIEWTGTNPCLEYAIPYTEANKCCIEYGDKEIISCYIENEEMVCVKDDICESKKELCITSIQDICLKYCAN